MPDTERTVTAVARTPTRPKTMNKTEAAYADMLAIEQRSGEIADYRYEAVTLTLAPAQGEAKSDRYTPDFMVIRPSGLIEFHEVKGHWRDDARTKIKVAADKYPMFVFVACRGKKRPKRDGGGYEWTTELFTELAE